MDAISGLAETIHEKLTDLYHYLSDHTVGIFSALIQPLQSIYEWLKDNVLQRTSEIKEIIKQAVEGALAMTVGGLGLTKEFIERILGISPEEILNGIKNAFTKITDFLMSDVGKMLQELATNPLNIMNDLEALDTGMDMFKESKYVKQLKDWCEMPLGE